MRFSLLGTILVFAVKSLFLFDDRKPPPFVVLGHLFCAGQ
jgi:hypothetical protein